jgi:hypothetical protein
MDLSRTNGASSAAPRAVALPSIGLGAFDGAKDAALKAARAATEHASALASEENIARAAAAGSATAAAAATAASSLGRATTSHAASSSAAGATAVVDALERLFAQLPAQRQEAWLRHRTMAMTQIEVRLLR